MARDRAIDTGSCGERHRVDHLRTQACETRRPAMETRAKVLHWFIRGGTLVTPGGTRSIDVEPIVIGRTEGADVVLDDHEVSGVHVELRAITEGIAVRDLGSTNGTFIGAVRIREVVVTAKTEITVGNTRLTIEPSGQKRRVEL